MIRRTLKRAGLGLLLGMAVGNIIAALTGHDNIVAPSLMGWAGSLPRAFLIQTLLSGLIGAAAMAGVGLYEIDRWPLLLIDLTHYASYMVVFLPVSRLLGWWETPLEGLIMAGVLLVTHFMIFLIMCWIYRAQVKELNQLNKERKHNKNDTGGAP